MSIRPKRRELALGALFLGLGAGLFATAHGIADSILWRPLNFDPQNRAVHLTAVDADRLLRYPYFSYGQSQLFSESGCWNGFAVIEDGSPSNIVNLLSGDFPDQVFSAHVSPSFFRFLHVPLILGRHFGREPLQSGGVVISERLWKARLGGSSPLGQATLNLDGVPVSVIGVFSSRFAWSSPMGNRVDILAPLSLPTPESAPLPSYRMVAALSDAARLRDCERQMDAVFQAHVRSQGGFAAQMAVIPIKEQLIEGTRSFLAILLGISFLILLLAVLNALGLALIDRERRATEMVVRRAIGADFKVLLGLKMRQALALGLSSALVAFVVLQASLHFARLIMPDTIPRSEEIDITFGSILIATATCFTGSFALSILALLGHRKGEISTLLRQSAQGQMSRSALTRLRRVVVFEVAIAAALLFGAFLMLKSYLNVSSLPLGFHPDGLYAANVHLPFEAKEQAPLFFEEFLREARSLPGVEEVALTSSIPLKPRDYKLSGGWRLRRVSAGFFRALGVQLVQGRAFSLTDRKESAAVAVVSRDVARKAYPGGQALGGLILDRYRIIGVVPELRFAGPGLEAVPTIYLHHLQSPDPRMNLIIRTSGDAEGLLNHLRALLKRQRPDLPISGFYQLSELLRRSDAVESRRFFVQLLMTFSFTGLLLAAAGIYVISSLTLLRRRHEFGIRKALGATSGMILREALAFSLRLTLVGGAIGLGAGLLAVRFLSSYLFQIAGYHSRALFGVCSLLLIVALLSGFLPGLRASREDPRSALLRVD